jgi:hypothetical protein
MRDKCHAFFVVDFGGLEQWTGSLWDLWHLLICEFRICNMKTTAEIRTVSIFICVHACVSPEILGAPVSQSRKLGIGKKGLSGHHRFENSIGLRNYTNVTLYT